MQLIPWSKKTPVVEGSGVNRATELATKEQDDEIVIYKGNPIASRPQGSVVQVRPKSLKIGGKVYNVDPHQLIRMIKQVTQTIGEYKDKDNPYAGYVVGALRKARADMVSDLEHHFNIHWQIDEASGRSIFYM